MQAALRQRCSAQDGLQTGVRQLVRLLAEITVRGVTTVALVSADRGLRDVRTLLFGLVQRDLVRDDRARADGFGHAC